MSSVPKATQRRVRIQARDRCGYCRSSQKYILGLLEIEHIHPEALGGTNEEQNLWLACRLCNGFKGVQTHGRDPIHRHLHMSWAEPLTPLDLLNHRRDGQQRGQF